MKKLILLAAVAVAAMACTKQNEAEYIGNTGIDATIGLAISQTDMGGGEGLAPRRAAQEAADLASQTKYITAVLMKADGSIAAQVQQTNTQQGYGSLSLDVPVGEYTLCVFANSSQQPSVNQDGTLAVAKPGDAFSGTAAVTVTRSARASASVSATRCVAKLSVTSTDVCTADKVQITVGGVSSIYSISGHKGTNAVEYATATINCPQNEQNQLAFGVYTILPAASISNASLTMVFKDAQGATVNTCSYTNIPLCQNKVTNATGAFFHELGGDAMIILNTDWDEPIDCEL